MVQQSYASTRSFAPPAFHDLLVEQLRSTPWFLISLALHALIALLLSFFTNKLPTQALVVAIHSQLAENTLELPILEPTEMETEEKITPDEIVTEDPVVSESEVSKVNETDNDEPTEEAKGEEEASSHEPFDAKMHNTSIGIGGGLAGAKGGPFGGRLNRHKNRSGGTPEVVESGLDWLKRHQSPDGSWDCDGYYGSCDAALGVRCEGKGNAIYDVGVTGLALLAFLGDGNTHREGPHRVTVASGLKWLKNQQDAEGCFGPRGDPHFTYNHMIAALAMAEAYGMSRSGLWKGSAQNAIDFVMHTQNPYKAWRYGVRPGDNDASVTGWAVMALKSAKMASLNVSDTSLTWAHDFIKEITDEETGRCGYTQRGERPVRPKGRETQFPAEESESMTAVGVLTRVFCGENPSTSPMIKAGAELIQKRLPVWEPNAGKVDMYYWYYATLAMFQVGGSGWAAWNNKMQEAIIKTQRSVGCNRGSWDPVDPWGEDAGRVYSTAVMTLCMEVYYRYGKVFGTK